MDTFADTFAQEIAKAKAEHDPQQPGKFEEELWFVQFLWQISEWADATYLDSAGVLYDIWKVDSELRALLELDEEPDFLVLHEDSQGFVYCDFWEQEEWEKAVAENENRVRQIEDRPAATIKTDLEDQL